MNNIQMQDCKHAEFMGKLPIQNFSSSHLYLNSFPPVAIPPETELPQYHTNLGRSVQRCDSLRSQEIPGEERSRQLPVSFPDARPGTEARQCCDTM